MAAQEATHPVHRRGWPGLNRLLGQHPLQVLRQRRGAAVAVFGAFGERLANHGTEIAGELTRELSPGGSPELCRVLVDGGAQAKWVPLNDGELELCDGRELDMVRRLSGQELEENHSKGVDIAGRAERLAEDLLGARVRRGEHSSGPFRHGALRRGRFRREQLCDAEVQQPDVAFCRDEDVGGLEVAVEHEVRVCELDRGQHLVEQRDACPDVEASPVGERGDRLAVDHFHGEVGLPLRRDTGIVQARDVGVLQASEDVALEGKSGSEVPGKRIAQRQLERHLALEAAIGTPSDPHLSHSPGAERAEEDVRPDGLPGNRAAPGRDRGRPTDRALVRRLVFFVQEPSDGRSDLHGLTRESRSPGEGMPG